MSMTTTKTMLAWGGFRLSTSGFPEEGEESRRILGSTGGKHVILSEGGKKRRRETEKRTRRLIYV